MKLDKFLLFSTVFLALVVACHTLQDVNKLKAYDTNIEAYYATTEAYSKVATKLYKLCLVSNTFLVFVVCILHYMTDNFWSDSYAVKIKAYLKVRACRKTADAYASDAVAFQQRNDAVSAIKAYKQAAKVYRHMAAIAQKVYWFTKAIKASMREAQMYKHAAQLCKEANDIEKEASLFALAAAAYERVAVVCAQLANKYGGNEGRIGEALAWLMSAYAHIKSANSCKDASGAGRKNAMYNRAACCYINAASAYRFAGNNDDAIKARQQAIKWLKTASQMYHDARDYMNEAFNYYDMAACHCDLNEHAQAGAAFELAAHAYLQARNTAAAVVAFREARELYVTAWDPVALERVQSMIATLSS